MDKDNKNALYLDERRECAYDENEKETKLEAFSQIFTRKRNLFTTIFALYLISKRWIITGSAYQFQ